MPRDDVGAGDVEDLVAALEAGEVVEDQVGCGGLQHGAHGAVGDDDPLVEGVEEAGVGRQLLHVGGFAGHPDRLPAGTSVPPPDAWRRRLVR